MDMMIITMMIWKTIGTWKCNMEVVPYKKEEKKMLKEPILKILTDNENETTILIHTDSIESTLHEYGVSLEGEEDDN